MSHKTNILIDGKKVETLADILPVKPGLEILFIAKTPAPLSVAAGHYFQGKQGKMFWNALSKHNILTVHHGEFEDDHLIENLYGITDIVKIPRGYGNEPSDDAYRGGLDKILDLIRLNNPKVICFVYKKVLDQILKLSFNIREKSLYGFNPKLEKYFETKVFVFPMPGTPCKKELAVSSMYEFKDLLNK